MSPKGIHGNEANQRVSSSARRVQIAAAVIVAADLSIMAWGLLAVFSPQVLVAGFVRYTGQSWVELMQEAPEIGNFLLLAFRLVGALNVAAALPLITIALTAFRAQQRWAWWTLLVGNTIALGAPMAYDQFTGAIGVFEIGEWVVLGLVYVALALTWRR